jgi:hypothetical protein
VKRFRLYTFSRDTLTFQELKWGRTRLLAWGLVAGIALLLGALEINQRTGDRWSLGFTRTNLMKQENRVLRQQLQMVTHRIQQLEGRLAELNDHGNHLRLLADLPTISEDERQAGVGGAVDEVDFATSPDVSTLLNRLRNSVASAERELSLQVTSYRDMSAKFETNKARFAHLPAIRPMEGYYSRRGIGLRLHPILNYYRPHEGLDIANDVGTQVHATGDGVVSFAGRSGGLGIMVEVDHGFSYHTVYGHLSKVLVREGQRVKRGDVIARSGNTGLSSGPHLHYEVRLNGIAQNPLEYFLDDVPYEDDLAGVLSGPSARTERE